MSWGEMKTNLFGRTDDRIRIHLYQSAIVPVECVIVHGALVDIRQLPSDVQLGLQHCSPVSPVVTYPVCCELWTTIRHYLRLAMIGFCCDTNRYCMFSDRYYRVCIHPQYQGGGLYGVNIS